MVETTIDLAELERNNYVIKPEFDEALQELQVALDGVRESLDETHSSVARDLGMEADNKVLHFEQHAVYGHCFRLTKKVRFSCLVFKCSYCSLTAFLLLLGHKGRWSHQK